ncbi:MAG: carboxypeptidase regulatory-like domain-containing protein [Pyrinomonadaceae bacterium]|nr:carboxypeptidase regulatory-like domain-containing protein [Pyrinomonadaceae bacterium]
MGTVSYSSHVTVVDGSDFKRQQRLVRLTIDQVFRGIDGAEVEVLTGLGDADCGYGFKLGGQYLVYANRSKDNRLYTSTCSRTRQLSEATEDLAFIRGLTKAASGSTIFGEVKRVGESEPTDRLKPVDDIRIIIESPSKRVEVTTNSKGKFRASGLPPDTYKVKVDLPEGLSIYNPERETKVFDRGCAQVEFWVEADTRITGKVFDAQGQPASDVLMELVPMTPGENNAFPVYVRTDKDGKYEMRLVKPGRYLLGVRIFGSAGATYVPFPRTYHPGVSEETRATIFTITEGQRIEAMDLILPARLVERTLNGVVVSPDGQPVKGAVVWLKEREYSDRDMPYREVADDEGRFSFKVYEGFKYTLNAYIEAKPQKRSEIMEVRVSENPRVIKLVLNYQK